MGTSAPAIREHDVPLTEPYRPPRKLNPGTPAPDYVPSRVRQPAIVPVKEQEEQAAAGQNLL